MLKSRVAYEVMNSLNYQKQQQQVSLKQQLYYLISLLLSLSHSTVYAALQIHLPTGPLNIYFHLLKSKMYLSQAIRPGFSCPDIYM